MTTAKLLKRIFTIIAVLVVGYYLMTFSAPVAPSIQPLSPARTSGILDAKTGQPMSPTEIAQITERQKKARRTYVLSGTVIERLDDSIQVQIAENGQPEKWLLRLKFSPKAVFLKEVPLPDFKNNPSSMEENEISLTEVNVGDVVSFVFPNGVILDDVKEMGMVQVGNLTVNLPRGLVPQE